MRKHLVCVILLIVAATPALALDRGFYLGAGFGFSSFDVADFNEEYATLRFEDDGFGIKAFAGYQILEYLAVEVAYTKPGKVTMHEVATWLEHQEMSVEISAWDLSVVGTLPVGSKVNLFAKLGAASWDADVKVRLDDVVAEDHSRDGTDLIVGLGVDLVFKKLGVRVEADWLNMSDTNGAILLTGNLTYRF